MPRREQTPHATPLLVFLGLLGLGGTMIATNASTFYGRVLTRLDDIEHILEGIDLQALETTWTDSDGLIHTVSTPRDDNETLDDWTLRHKAAVDAMKKLYPPV